MSKEPNQPDTDNTDVDPDEQKVTIQVRDGGASFGLTVLGASAGEVADEIERLQLEGQCRPVSRNRRWRWPVNKPA